VLFHSPDTAGLPNEFAQEAGLESQAGDALGRPEWATVNFTKSTQNLGAMPLDWGFNTNNGASQSSALWPWPPAHWSWFPAPCIILLQVHRVWLCNGLVAHYVK